MSLNENPVPATIVGLENWMKAHCFNFNNYSINGNSIHEGYGIDQLGKLFAWYYTERGQKNNLQYFQTESEITAFAFNEINKDKWARTHCIGFTTDEREKQELKGLLEEMNIEFMQDEIPYYGPDKPVFRIFVFGCDIHRVSHLKAKYYQR